MNEALMVECGGQSFQLLPQGGLYWPSQLALLVADTHFGKEATFRRQNIPVPAGVTQGTLAAISSMLQHLPVRRFIFLGDLFHASNSGSPEVRRSIDAFFQRWSEVEFWLTLGNHDRGISRLLRTWPIHCVEQKDIDGVELGHYPREEHSQSADEEMPLRVCGHLHPAYRLSHRVEGVQKLACFWYSGRQLVLPAIGQFTGTQRIQPRAQDRVWVLADGQVIDVSSRRSSSTSRL
ncbi:MAG: ligase-associated DNA damage response endonuclease PdeM [bacterium]|nr:ligase-associated DNA damage response endonuclease PdeM [bacterium]